MLVIFSCQAAPESALSTSTVTTNEAVSEIDSREYFVRLRLELKNTGLSQPEKQNLWVALIRDVPPYQALVSRRIYSQKYSLIQDEYGNQYAEFDLTDHPAGDSIRIDFEYRVTVNELVYSLNDCAGDLPADFTMPELHIESSNPQIVDLANQLSRGQQTICDQVRSFYNYVGDELVYSYNGKDWGAQAALGPMGADCTEYTSLLMALTRSQDVPTRYYEGLRFLDSSPEVDSRIEHAWPDVFLPGSGWVALDPTLGRSRLERENYYAHYTPDHIIITTGRNPSTLRGSSYWTHLYWPGDSTSIVVKGEWTIERIGN